MSNENTVNAASEAPKPGTKAYVEAELAAAKAELEALKAEKEAQAAAKDESDAPSVPVEERVDLFVEKGYANDEHNHLVAVNGVNYLLPRGKTSNVPKYVADEYYRSRKAQQALDETVDKMLAAASK